VKPTVLLVDDEPSILFGYRKFLERLGYETVESGTLSEARASLEDNDIDAMLLDLNLPDGNGLDLVPEVRASSPDMAIVVITGVGDVPTAVEALRRGADNFLTKPVDMKGLEVFLSKSIEVGGLRRSVLARRRLKKSSEPYVGVSPQAAAVQEYATLASENDSPILVQGETGTGKGIIARWIHERSARADEPFVEVNCSSLGGDLLLSELFGHAKGAFTSAVSEREGLVEVANKGTLFLDEIGDMDMAVQPQFLKVIEEQTYRRVGETRMRKSNFRLICATNKNLEVEAADGRFRNDLLYRINVLPISLTPLRQRQEDIPGYISHLLEALGAGGKELSGKVMQVLTSYQWPGNVRELKNVLERAILLSRGGELEAGHLSGLSGADAPVSDLPAQSTTCIQTLEEMEEQYVASVYESLGQDVQKTSETLGISRSTLYRKLKDQGNAKDTD